MPYHAKSLSCVARYQKWSPDQSSLTKLCPRACPLANSSIKNVVAEVKSKKLPLLVLFLTVMRLQYALYEYLQNLLTNT